jgi:hypothetical protein
MSVERTLLGKKFEMRIPVENRIQYFENAITLKQKEFIKNDGHCVLCSSALEITHKNETHEHSIREQAFCVECDVRARVKIYTLN